MKGGALLLLFFFAMALHGAYDMVKRLTEEGLPSGSDFLWGMLEALTDLRGENIILVPFAWLMISLFIFWLVVGVESWLERRKNRR
jgi:hypothetical protein